MQRSFILFVFMCLIINTLSAQNTLVFKESGETLTGKITNVDDKVVTLLKDGKEYKFYKSDLSSFDYVQPQVEKPIVNTNQQLLKVAGEEFIKGSNSFQTGFILSILGSGAFAYGLSINTYDNYNDIKYNQKRNFKIITTFGGGAMVLVGSILEVAAFSHYKKAGLLLTNNSIGVSIKL